MTDKEWHDDFTDFLHHVGEFQDKPPIIRIVLGDITKIKADAIVNAANSTLLGGGGVDGAIHKAAGPELLNECKKIREEKYPEGLPSGEAVATKAYNLPAKIIIHTVGPEIFYYIPRKYLEILRSCYINCLELAEGSPHFCKSIAFPAISTGSCEFPILKSAEVVKNTFMSFKSRDIKEIILVLYKKEDFEVYKKVFEENDRLNLVERER